MSTCRRCGGLLDAARENPKTRRYGRKCPDCLRWHDTPAGVRPGEGRPVAVAPR
jgi:hypothetical protein